MSSPRKLDYSPQPNDVSREAAHRHPSDRRDPQSSDRRDAHPSDRRDAHPSDRRDAHYSDRRDPQYSDRRDAHGERQGTDDGPRLTRNNTEIIESPSKINKDSRVPVNSSSPRQRAQNSSPHQSGSNPKSVYTYDDAGQRSPDVRPLSTDRTDNDVTRSRELMSATPTGSHSYRPRAEKSRRRSPSAGERNAGQSRRDENNKQDDQSDDG